MTVYDTMVPGFAHLEVAIQKLAPNLLTWQLSLWSEEFEFEWYLVAGRVIVSDLTQV